MKIVIATPFYPPEKGVSALYSSGLEKALIVRGHEVSVVPFSTVARVPPGIRHLWYGLFLAQKSKGADYILALDTWSVGLPAYFVSKFLRLPLILRIGGDYLWESYAERTKKPIRFSDIYGERAHFTWKENLILRLTRTIVRHAHVLFFNTRFQISAWQPIYGFESKRAVVLENVYPARIAGIRPPQGKVFVAAGRPIALKNYDLLERVITRIQKTNPGVSLDRRNLPPDEHRARLQDAYAVLIPSLSEISSNTAIDAVIAGKPFIMTDDTGTKERLSELGLFIDTRSEDALVAAIEKLLDPQVYEDYTQRIVQFGLTRTWDDLAEEICAHL